jgi:predicted transcriptional regulator
MQMPTPRKIRITVGLEQRDYDALATLAEQEERSLSWMVAQAVKEFLRGREEGVQYRLRFDGERQR